MELSGPLQASNGTALPFDMRWDNYLANGRFKNLF